MEITNPRRILAVSPPDAGLLDLVKNLTGTPPSITDTVAGTTHTLPLKTAYFTASISIWLDEIDDAGIWAAEFLAPEAKEVLAVLGAYIVCFRRPVDNEALDKVRELLTAVQNVVNGSGYGWDGVCLAIAMPQSIVPALEMGAEEWDDLCTKYGFEFVDSEATGKNQYSGMMDILACENVGMQRLKEALEANDWEAGDEELEDLGFDDFKGDGDGDDADSLGFSIEPADMEAEMFGMQQAIYSGTQGKGKTNDGEDDDDVEQLQTMMLKLQAARVDLGSDLPEKERRKLAVKAVNDIMETL
ncbi:hypothetical protein BJ878DRAFT_430866 [Calycina marina]|uniref:Increased recombination centers protein 6 n=1 Tax=Calycina marina TaxID=1763456 RepID=A0A9P7YUU9_9HELO|nr:hypothetical protein BJ878DRAFT_430866 [Calycina marina]